MKHWQIPITFFIAGIVYYGAKGAFGYGSVVHAVNEILCAVYWTTAAVLLHWLTNKVSANG